MLAEAEALAPELAPSLQPGSTVPSVRPAPAIVVNLMNVRRVNADGAG
jgi:hypothetical protein